jgi:hypothetical protein
MSASPLTLLAPGLALALALSLAACSGDDSQSSATESTTSSTSTSTTTTGETSSSTTADTTSTTGGVCEAEEPFALSIASDADTYGTCGTPFEFFAKRKAGGFSVERCTDDTCSSCDPNLAYDLDFGSSTAVPEETCLKIAHETKTVDSLCRSRSFVIWQIGETAPLIVATSLTPEPPPALTPATLESAAVSPRECSCSSSGDWCCGDAVTQHNIQFIADGGDPVSVSPGLANFKMLSFAGANYEAVVTQAYEQCDGGELLTGWYLRKK